MGRISTGIGLVSGINSKDIIDQLMSIEQQPKTLLQTRKATVDAQKDAYSGILTQLSDLQGIGRSLERPTTFTASDAKSSDENVLTATAAASAAVGSFQFQVARLVTSQQSVTGGYSNASATVGAGTLTIELGGGNLDSETPLSQLNGGDGVSRGQFRITDRSGKSSVIDISSAVSLDDVIHKINTSLDISVRASVQGDKVVLTDSSGQTTSDLIVQDIGEGKSAADLGIATDVAADTLTGSDINSLGTATSLNSLNDGRGVRTAGSATPDFHVALGDGTGVDVALTGALTIGDVIQKINAAGGGKLKASVADGGNGLTLTDTSGGAFTVTALNDSQAAADLGVLKSGAGGTLAGSDVLAGLNTVLISSLKGGAGLPLGRISITDRAGHNAQVDLSGAKSVQDILDGITNATGIAVTASLNSSGNGIQITDRSGGTGNVVIADVNSTTAAGLGIVGTFDTTKTAVAGSNLQLAWVSENTLLSDYNGGKGVTPGSFKITNSAGQSTTVNLAVGTFNTLGDVIKEINTLGTNLGIKASVNANGDGLLLTDTANGAGKLKVDNINGTAATDLRIAGAATATTIDGTFEKTIDVTDSDTLTTVQGKIQSLGFGVAANIINDGSGESPFRLSLNAFNSGRAGRVVFDAGATSLQTKDLVAAQDAAVFVGGQGAEPLLVTSSQNQLANVIPGVTIDLHGVSNGPVSLNITRNADSVVDQVQKFVDGFNAVVDKIDDLTKYDTDKQQAGLLLGESTITQVQSEIYVALQSVVQGAGRYRILSDVGLTLGDGAKITFDPEKFRSAFATDPDAVKNLFSQTTGTTLSDTTKLSVLNDGRGVTIGSGADFRITSREGTNYDITLPIGGTIGDVIQAINTKTAGKVTASIASNGKGLSLLDSTTGTSILTVASLNGSVAANDLGISGTAIGTTLAGRPIFSPTSATGGGFGYLIDRSLTTLTDPVSGAIPRENQTLDSRAQQFQDRMDQLDKLLADKRTRLETQFANMESVLAKLQGQQSALGSLGSVQAAPASSK